ncbi:putative WSC domain-containing protein [Seiridium unicorne]|uniref:WSC domain-containing protein n=1 Tax=Seiridium unicorne TaxID=138068 RepID=A0ABR2UV72_9PEZI
MGSFCRVKPAAFAAFLWLLTLADAQGFFYDDFTQVCSSQQDFQYLGCFATTSQPWTYNPTNRGGDPSRSWVHWDQGDNVNITTTPYFCTDTCRAHGFKYAATWDRQCRCGMALQSSVKDLGSAQADDTLCTAAGSFCPGDRRENCGTNQGARIWADPSFQEESLLPDPAILATQYNVLGCFYHANLPSGDATVTTTTQSSTATCFTYCADLGYPLTFMAPLGSGSVKCSCGQDFGVESRSYLDVSDQYCSTACDTGLAGGCTGLDCCGNDGAQVYPVYANPNLLGCHVPQIPGYADQAVATPAADSYTCIETPASILARQPYTIAYGAAATISRSATFVATAQAQATPYVNYGCYSGLTLAGALGGLQAVPTNLLAGGVVTVQTCTEYCDANDYPYAGLTSTDVGTSACFCGTGPGAQLTNSNIQAMEDCNYPCSGSLQENCGSPNGPLVYVASNVVVVGGAWAASYTATYSSTPIYSCTETRTTTSSSSTSTVTSFSSTITSTSSTVTASSSTETSSSTTITSSSSTDTSSSSAATSAITSTSDTTTTAVTASSETGTASTTTTGTTSVETTDTSTTTDISSTTTKDISSTVTTDTSSSSMVISSSETSSTIISTSTSMASTTETSSTQTTDTSSVSLSTSSTSAATASTGPTDISTSTSGTTSSQTTDISFAVTSTDILNNTLITFTTDTSSSTTGTTSIQTSGTSSGTASTDSTDSSFVVTLTDRFSTESLTFTLLTTTNPDSFTSRTDATSSGTTEASLTTTNTDTASTTISVASSIPTTASLPTTVISLSISPIDESITLLPTDSVISDTLLPTNTDSAGTLVPTVTIVSTGINATTLLSTAETATLPTSTQTTGTTQNTDMANTGTQSSGTAQDTNTASTSTETSGAALNTGTSNTGIQTDSSTSTSKSSINTSTAIFANTTTATSSGSSASATSRSGTGTAGGSLTAGSSSISLSTMGTSTMSLSTMGTSTINSSTIGSSTIISSMFGSSTTSPSTTSSSTTSSAGIPGVTNVPEDEIILAILPVDAGPLVNLTQRGLGDLAKRQATDGGFVGGAAPINPDSCNDATPFNLTNGRFGSGGQFVATNPGIAYKEFRVSPTGSISTTFTVSNGVLAWYNDVFYGGQAGFCQVPSGQIFVTFGIPGTEPVDCEFVFLVVYERGQCNPDGTIVSITSKISSISTAASAGTITTISPGTLTTTATSSGSGGDASATILPQSQDIFPYSASPADEICVETTLSWYPGQPTFLPAV